jgi:hypothetical protein
MKKISITVFLFLCVSGISILAYRIGTNPGAPGGKAANVSKGYELHKDIAVIDSVQGYIGKSRHPEALFNARFGIDKDHFLYPVLFDSKLTDEEKIARLKSVRDSLLALANAGAVQGEKSGVPVSKRGTAYFISVWLLFLIVLSVVRRGGKNGSKKDDAA